MADELDVAHASELVRAALAALVADGDVGITVVDARPFGSAADLLVTLTATGPDGPGGPELLDVAMQAAHALAARDDISALVPGGIGVTTGGSRGSMDA